MGRWLGSEFCRAVNVGPWDGLSQRMESEGCVRDHVTYNILVHEFARGGLLKRMERMYQSLMSRKMTLEPVTLVSMLEAYAEVGVLEKMEEAYDKILRFSRLDDLGRAYSKMGDFQSVELLLSELQRRRGVKPDLVTLGIVFDLSEAGFDGTGVFMISLWR
ncbi:unnamed protein product [Eruca vesicaria subsp. sativa]|uniref:Pentatricopeptide repeat-containing protein n=1 Tax=Eruca vesicaria subsp. sativa TaxID=29727 RepID=A0ABC8JXJ0_ERUVS|nr:unnamed protein product [Eruca vesicaria subsp. sativa]